MHQAASALLNSLSLGKNITRVDTVSGSNPVGRIARVYEIARNALEFRADHLVRRAAIERILRRQVMFEKDPERLTAALLQELNWARYVGETEVVAKTRKEIELVMAKFLLYGREAKVDREWLLGLISAEIEEQLNPNSDYHKFTYFAFHVFKSRVKLTGVENLDLVLWVAIDRVFSQADEPQVAYHLEKLMGSELTGTALVEQASKLYLQATKSPVLNKISVFVRKQMGPLVLLRDVYFVSPKDFSKLFEDKNLFESKTKEVLKDQLSLIKGRMNRATVRSLIYVFLTKMVLGILVEVPLEIFFRGGFSKLTLGINLLFPVVVMWLLTANIKLPKKDDQDRIVARTTEMIWDFDKTPSEQEILLRISKPSLPMSILFYVFYGLLFVTIFAGITLTLRAVGFGLVSWIIFNFFLCVVSFFTYRIRQSAQMYAYRPRVRERSTWGEMLMLPIVVVGGWVSVGVSRLNFLVFVFDFILEAPFKLILRFLDEWSQFLSLKRDEVVG